ncbi:citrate transporter, partial [Salmonella enterica]
LGLKEESRLGLGKGSTVDFVQQHELSEAQLKIRRPQNFWANIVLTVFVLGVMISGKVDPVVMFMIGVVLALMINYRDV